MPSRETSAQASVSLVTQKAVTAHPVTSTTETDVQRRFLPPGVSHEVQNMPSGEVFMQLSPSTVKTAQNTPRLHDHTIESHVTSACCGADATRNQFLNFSITAFSPREVTIFPQPTAPANRWDLRVRGTSICRPPIPLRTPRGLHIAPASAGSPIRYRYQCPER